MYIPAGKKKAYRSRFFVEPDEQTMALSPAQRYSISTYVQRKEEIERSTGLT
jgi:hypothetical protein